MFTDVVLRPSFTNEDVSLVQKRMIVSLSDDTDSPDVYLQRLQERVAYAGHPYVNSTSGTPESVGEADAGRSAPLSHEADGNVADAARDRGRSEPERRARSWSPRVLANCRAGLTKRKHVPALAFDKSTVEVTPRELPTNYIQGLFTAPSLTSPDIYAMRVASSLLRDRVFEEVRVKRNLSYAPDAFLRTQAANVGGLYVTAVDANQSIRVMLNEISRLQAEPVSCGRYSRGDRAVLDDVLSGPGNECGAGG